MLRQLFRLGALFTLAALFTLGPADPVQATARDDVKIVYKVNSPTDVDAFLVHTGSKAVRVVIRRVTYRFGGQSGDVRLTLHLPPQVTRVGLGKARKGEEVNVFTILDAQYEKTPPPKVPGR